MSSTATDGPLKGIRVIDMTTMLSGPWATMVLADQGADVIKIEAPERGDHVRSLGHRRAGMSAMFLNINRNKRSLAVDLKHPSGVEVLERLARTADVFVQNFRPGVAERLGLGPERLQGLNPRLVYASVNGFGERGPWARKPVYDPIIQAVTGLTTVQAGGDAQRPRLVRTVLPDKVSALTCAQAITSALWARERSGRGPLVQLSMLDSVMYFLWASDMGAQTYPDDPAEPQAAASFIDLIYETADGHMTVAVMNDREWAALAQAVDHPEWVTDPRFATAAARDRHVNERLEMTQAVLRGRTTADWMQRLEAHDVPCAPALTRSQALLQPQLQAMGTLVEYEHPHAGRLRQARPPARFDRATTAIRRGAPLLGEHNRELLRELGFADRDIAQLARSGVIGRLADNPVAA